jgi:hypothetical protein
MELAEWYSWRRFGRTYYKPLLDYTASHLKIIVINEYHHSALYCMYYWVTSHWRKCIDLKTKEKKGNIYAKLLVSVFVYNEYIFIKFILGLIPVRTFTHKHFKFNVSIILLGLSIADGLFCQVFVLKFCAHSSFPLCVIPARSFPSHNL